MVVVSARLTLNAAVVAQRQATPDGQRAGAGSPARRQGHEIGDVSGIRNDAAARERGNRQVAGRRIAGWLQVHDPAVVKVQRAGAAAGHEVSFYVDRSHW